MNTGTRTPGGCKCHPHSKPSIKGVGYGGRTSPLHVRQQTLTTVIATDRFGRSAASHEVTPTGARPKQTVRRAVACVCFAPEIGHPVYWGPARFITLNPSTTQIRADVALVNGRLRMSIYARAYPRWTARRRSSYGGRSLALLQPQQKLPQQGVAPIQIIGMLGHCSR